MRARSVSRANALLDLLLELVRFFQTKHVATLYGVLARCSINTWFFSSFRMNRWCFSLMLDQTLAFWAHAWSNNGVFWLRTGQATPQWSQLSADLGLAA